MKKSKLSLFSVTFITTTYGLIESERMEEYHRRGHNWPPKLEDYTPSTTGWKKLYEGLFHQLQYSAEESPGERYESYMGTINSALMSKNFTEYGWGISKAPKPIVDKLKKRLHDGLNSEAKHHEGSDECLETNLLPYFFQDDGMNREILESLKPLHEAWIGGVELVPYYAYGLRVYRNDSNLLMHVDKPDTHVISSILHVDHGENDEPWPLVIEDFNGNTNEVFLQSGDLLFYESSKCRHGRPKKYKGKFYSSLFSHYHPKNWDWEKQKLDIHYRIPSSDYWYKSAGLEGDNDIDEMKLVSLCMKEPQCEHEWCRLNNTLKWFGPAPEYGKVLSGNGETTFLRGIPEEESFREFEDEF